MINISSNPENPETKWSILTDVKLKSDTLFTAKNRPEANWTGKQWQKLSRNIVVN